MKHVPVQNQLCSAAEPNDATTGDEVFPQTCMGAPANPLDVLGTERAFGAVVLMPLQSGPDTIAAHDDAGALVS